jgi:hypothetical protein
MLRSPHPSGCRSTRRRRGCCAACSSSRFDRVRPSLPWRGWLLTVFVRRSGSASHSAPAINRLIAARKGLDPSSWVALLLSTWANVRDAEAKNAERSEEAPRGVGRALDRQVSTLATAASRSKSHEKAPR